jgi:flagellar hook-length control protein FliK
VLNDDTAHIIRFSGEADRDTVRDAITALVNLHRTGGVPQTNATSTVSKEPEKTAASSSTTTQLPRATSTESIASNASAKATTSRAAPVPRLSKEDIRARQALLAKNADLRKRMLKNMMIICFG